MASNMSRRNWQKTEDTHLKQLIKQNTPTRIIALKLKRSESSIRNHVQKLGLSLKPTNQSPYG